MERKDVKRKNILSLKVTFSKQFCSERRALAYVSLVGISGSPVPPSRSFFFPHTVFSFSSGLFLVFWSVALFLVVRRLPAAGLIVRRRLVDPSRANSTILQHFRRASSRDRWDILINRKIKRVRLLGFS